MTFTIKICGLNDATSLDAALEAGADMVGFVFFEQSPRNISFETARSLGRQVRGRARKVALTVDVDDATLATIIDTLNPDLLQLHGHETPARIASIRAQFGVPAMRALAITDRRDLDLVPAFDAVADRLLFDARPPKGADRPGGHGAPFDWRVLHGLSTRKPWLLAGGLKAANVAQAIAATAAPGIDVSSGVESMPGRKDPAMIADFVTRARNAARTITAA